MAGKRGKVIRVDQKTMVVVTDEGDFLNVPILAERPRPGDVVEVLERPAKRFTVSPWLRVAVAVLVIGLSLALARPLVIPQAVAAVSMDLSSSVELSINRDNKVIKVKANNQQGEAVLQDLHLMDMDIYQAANLVTAKAIEMGYLKSADEGTVMVTVAPLTDKGLLAVDRAKLQQVMHDELTKKQYQGYLVVNQSAGEISKEAAKMGLTVNQYMVWKQAKNQAAQVNIEAIKDQPIEKVIPSNETNLNRMFPGMWCRVGRMGNAPGNYPSSNADSVDSASAGTTGGNNSSGTDQTGAGQTTFPDDSAGNGTADSTQTLQNSLMPQGAGFGPGSRMGPGGGGWMTPPWMTNNQQ